MPGGEPPRRAAGGVPLARGVYVALARGVGVPVAHDDAVYMRVRACVQACVQACVAIVVLLDNPFVGNKVTQAVVYVMAFLIFRVYAFHHAVGAVVGIRLHNLVCVGAVPMIYALDQVAAAVEPVRILIMVILYFFNLLV